MKLGRRSFVGGSVAFIACGGRAQAVSALVGGQASTINFEEAGGSVSNSGERNRRVYLTAIGKLGRNGGGTLFVPPKVYPFSGTAETASSNASVLATGATFKGPNCMISIDGASRGFNISGLRLVDTSGDSARYLLNCAGSDCHFKNMHLEKDPPTGGYIGYCHQSTSGNLYENVSFSGSNGMYMGGHDHEVRGGRAEAFGGDDCWALKSTIAPCYNIRISGFEARGFAALVSIGSEVGAEQKDNPSRDRFVKDVIVENCTAVDCTYFAYIKPGGVESYDYRDGVVENIAINDCRIDDSSGEKFRNGIYVSPGRGAIVRGLRVNNFSVNARGKSPPVQTTGALYMRVMGTSNGEGVGATIEDVTVNGLRCIDPNGGIASGSFAWGSPIYTPISLEKHNPDVGRIMGVEVRNAFSDGCARSAVTVGSAIEGPIVLVDCEFRNFAAAIMAYYDTQAVVSGSPIELQNVVASPSPHAPEGTKGLP